MTRFFETTRHIDAPTQPVWEVLFDVARWPEWTPTIDSVERLDDGSFGVGSRANVVVVTDKAGFVAPLGRAWLWVVAVADYVF